MVERVRLEQPKPTIRLFLDSGVFSAWNATMKGRDKVRKHNKDHPKDQQPMPPDTVVDLHKYASFINRNAKWIDAYATIDQIPGEWGRKRTKEEVESSAKTSYDNQQTLKGLGLKPIPIFHMGEKFSWLERYLKDGEPYIGIATAKDVRNTEQREWLDHVFTMLTNKNGVPFVKTHGFGITNISLLQRYPWFTSDSTTWALAAGYGLVYVPEQARDGWDWKSIPTRIIMSGREQSAWSSTKRQYEALSPDERSWVDAWLAFIGTTPNAARYDPIQRRSACLKYFLEFSRNWVVKPWDHRHGEIPLRQSSETKMGWDRMRIIAATHMMNGQFSRIMSNAGCVDRLVSYWECMNKDDDVLRRYVAYGIHDVDYTPTKVKTDWQDDRYLAMRAEMLNRRIEGYGQDSID